MMSPLTALLTPSSTQTQLSLSSASHPGTSRSAWDDARVLAKLRTYQPSSQKMPRLETALDALCLSEFQLMDLFEQATYSECADFLSHVASLTFPVPLRAAELVRPVLSTGMPHVDQALGGGLHAGQVTELVGCASAGKTQWCLTMAARVALAGQGVVYIDTEGKFPAERLVGILRALGGTVDDARSVKVVKADGLAAAALLALMHDLEPTILRDRVGLLVCDSVAANVGLEFSRDTLPERQQALARQASQLKRLAETFAIPVLVTNQVRAAGSGGARSDVARVGGELVAALGPTWAHCVNVRLALEQGAGSRRVLRVAKSPNCKEDLVLFAVGKAGVESPAQLDQEMVDEIFEGLGAEEKKEDELSGRAAA